MALLALAAVALAALLMGALLHDSVVMLLGLAVAVPFVIVLIVQSATRLRNRRPMHRPSPIK